MSETVPAAEPAEPATGPAAAPAALAPARSPAPARAQELASLPNGAGADERLGAALAAGAALLFGTSYIATSVALVSFSPAAIGGWRGAGAALLLALVAVVRARSRDRRPPAGGPGPRPALIPDRRTLARLVVLGLLGGPGFVLGMNLAVAGSGATIAAFVAGLYAVLAAVMAPLVLGERLGSGALAGLAAALVGTALLAELDLAGPAIPGIVAGLGGAVSYAFFLLLSRRWRPAVIGAPGEASPGAGLSGERVTLAVFLVTALALLPASVLGDPAATVPVAPAPLALAGLAWLAIGPSLLANLMVQGSVRRVPARRTSSLLLLNPLTAALLAALLLGERLEPTQLVGALLV
ncbi:MAG: hypothetical protein RL338_1333, partial [Chloroflexota bacterium]